LRARTRPSWSKPDKIKALAELLEVKLVVEHDGAFRLASEVRP
jgi:hypothetical protein